MNTEVYVGNLSYETTENELRQLFSQAGTVARALLITDRISGMSAGMAFIEMNDRTGADQAVEMFNGTTLGNRQLQVMPAEHRRRRVPGRTYGPD